MTDIDLSSYRHYFTITPIFPPTIILHSLSGEMANDGEVRAEVIMHIKSIRETSVIVK